MEKYLHKREEENAENKQRVSRESVENKLRVS
jgi:hypothetical protein